MSSDSIVTDEARAMIGAETEAIQGYPISEHEIKRFAQAVDDQNPLWCDAEYAAQTPYGGIVAPPMYFEIPFAMDRWLSELRPDGIPKGDKYRIMPPLRAERGMAGGTEVEFFQPMRPGDVLTYQSKVVDIYEREGRTGRLAFVVVDTTYTNQSGEVVAVMRKTTIAR